MKSQNPANKPKSASRAAKPKTAKTAKTAAAKKTTARSKTVAASKSQPKTSSTSKSQPKTAAAAKSEPKISPPPKLKVPPILLEGDAPTPPPASGPGKRFAVGAAPSSEPAVPPVTELPESYGTKQLFLTARDPRWLFAHWDFSLEQIRELNVHAIEGHLALRVYEGDFTNDPLDEIQVHPESRNWFVPVPRGAARYVAELGYRNNRRHWVTVSQSTATITPPDSLSDDGSVRFATIPYDIPFTLLVANVKSAVREHVPLVEALQHLRAEGHPDLPAQNQVAGNWTPAQEEALAGVISFDQTNRIWIGSLEITELIRRRLQKEISSIGAAQLGLTSSLGSAFGVSSQAGSVSSPFGGVPRRRGFWFNVNAELIIYGATEPDATVTIGDRKIKLRPDGSFSFRFALPDGDYHLPASAHSADGEETRTADLRFKRKTAYHGDVGTHPQDKNLRPPVVAAVS